MAAHESVFEDVSAGFSQLCKTLLPSLEVELVKTGTNAAEGLQFRCVGRWDVCGCNEGICVVSAY